MGVHHDAFCFDPERFHSTLAGEVVIDGRFDGRRMKALARRVAREVTDERVDYLRSLDCPTGADPDVDDDELWDEWGAAKHYLIAMAPHLVPAPNLPPGLFPPGRLRTRFEDAYWLGDSPTGLLASAPPPIAFAVAECAFEYSYGGWLSVERAATLLSLLEHGGAQDAMYDGVRARIGAIAEPAMAMLTHCIERGQPLRLNWSC